MRDNIRAIVVMGVSGCGKSTVATAVCERMGATFIEGDAFHPEQNVAKMRSGMPLTDADRQGWLERLGRELANALAVHETAALACSALKRSYRDMLRAALPGLGFVYLELSRDAAASRVSQRAGHYMPASLVDSQFRDLEPPVGEPRVLTVNAMNALSANVDEVEIWWRDVATVSTNG